MQQQGIQNFISDLSLTSWKIFYKYKNHHANKITMYKFLIHQSDKTCLDTDGRRYLNKHAGTSSFRVLPFFLLGSSFSPSFSPSSVTESDMLVVQTEKRHT